MTSSPYPRPTRELVGLEAWREALGWVKEDWQRWLIAGIYLYGPILVAGAIQNFLNPNRRSTIELSGGELMGLTSSWLGTVVMLAGFAASGIGWLVAAQLARRRMAGEALTAADAVPNGEAWFKAVGLALILHLLAGFLVCFCVVPALILYGMWGGAFAVLAENPKASIGEAIRESNQVLKARLWPMVGFVLVAALLTALSVCCFVVPSLFFAAVMGVAMAVSYYSLRAHQGPDPIYRA